MTVNLNEEKLLLASIGRGDERAFRALYDLHFGKITAYVYKICKCRETTAEIVQDIFIKIWSDRMTIKNVDCIQAYIFVIAKNKSIDFLRRMARSPVVCDIIPPNIEEGRNETAEKCDARDLVIAIQSALAPVSRQKKEIFQLSKIEGWSHDEIAAKMSLSKSTVKNHLSETTKYLKKLPV